MTISLAAEKIFHLGPIPLSNTLITSWLILLTIGIILIIISKAIGKLIPSRSQNIVEFVIESLLKLFDSITQDRRLTKKFFPLVATIFIFVILSNWVEILPGVGTIGLKENHHLVPIFRSPSTDLNFTLALAITTVLGIQFFGITLIGFSKYLGKFFNFKNPIKLFIGLLEIISELIRILSFSLRLFGNIFAGQVLLIVIAFLIPFIAPLPFYCLEIFIGFIQALIFSMLSLVFLTAAVKIEAH